MNQKNIKIVFFGTPDFVIPILKSLEDNFEVVGIVTAPDKVVGRKQILTPSPIKFWTLTSQPRQTRSGEAEKKIFTPEKLDNDFISHLSLSTYHLFVVAAYGKIIPQEVLAIPKYGALNVHPSLLPQERGASPIQSVILKGEKETGLSIIKMDEKMDHGPIVFTKKISLSNTDNFQTLSKKMFDISAEVLPQVIKDFISGKIKPIKQNHDLATFNKIITKENGFFDINNPPDSEVLDRMIRAYYPWPTAWTKWGNKIVKFLPNRMVQLEGKKPTKLEDFLRGYPNFPIKSI